MHISTSSVFGLLAFAAASNALSFADAHGNLAKRANGGKDPQQDGHSAGGDGSSKMAAPVGKGGASSMPKMSAIQGPGPTPTRTLYTPATTARPSPTADKPMNTPPHETPKPTTPSPDNGNQPMNSGREQGVNKASDGNAPGKKLPSALYKPG
jgi:hypothetical protein